MPSARSAGPQLIATSFPTLLYLLSLRSPSRSIAIGLTTHISSKGFMLGIENVMYHKAVRPGDTIYAKAEVVEARESKSRPGFGIVKIRARAYNQKNELLLECDRVIMVPKRGYRWEF